MSLPAEDIGAEQPTWILVIDDLATRAQYHQIGDDDLTDAYHKALDLAIFLRSRIQHRKQSGQG